jgi:hypothetical protein
MTDTNHRFIGLRAPRAADWLLDLFVSQDQAPPILGDLREEFLAVASQRGMWSARLWYWRQVMKTVPHLFYAQLVLGPWKVFTAVVAGLVLLALAYMPFYAVQPVIARHYPAPSYWPEPLRLAWIALWDWVYPWVYPNVELMLPPILVGWIVARASKGRDMVVTIVFSCASLSLGMIDLLILFILFCYYPHVAPKPRSVWSFFWLTRPHEAIAAPIGIFIGGLIARMMPRVLARPAR